MSAPATDAVLVRADRRAARITLNRPGKRNALSLELMEELIATLHRLGEDPGVRAIVIDSAGPAFSAGHDLTEMIGRDVPFYQRLFDVCSELMETIHRVPQPVIAKVEGMATAAGCQLVAACDLAVAGDGALVNRVVPVEALEDEVNTIVDAIVASSPLTVGIGKEAFYAQIELDEHRAYDLTKAVMAMNARTDDAQEGMCAFLEKRPATWRSS